MATPTIYKPITATFTVSGSAITLTGLMDVQEQDAAEARETYSDGATAVTGLYYQKKKLTVSVTLEDNSKMASEVFVGQGGTLVVVHQAQLAGIGTNPADTKTVTYPSGSSTGKAVVTSVNRNHVFAGNPSMQIAFEVFEPGGDHTLLKSVA